MTIRAQLMDCPHCHSRHVVKNGRRNGKQSYLCRDCHCQFREDPQPRGYPLEVKALCVKMYLNGMGFRAIERVTDISHNSIILWVREFESAIEEENYGRCIMRSDAAHFIYELSSLPK